MKKLLLLTFFIPFLSFGQKFEVSEQAGCSLFSAGDNFYPDKFASFSNQVALEYYFTKRLSVGAFYEYERGTTIDNTFGIASDFNFRHFYTGIDLIESNVQPFMDQRYDPSYGFGLHIGAKQKISRHVSLTEQLGENILYLKVVASEIISTNPTVEYAPDPYTMAEFLPYLRIGLSYRL